MSIESADVVGDYVGATALPVKKRFKEVQGGMFFIDEAYSLCEGYCGYGDGVMEREEFFNMDKPSPFQYN